jgi:hypothetical protein
MVTYVWCDSRDDREQSGALVTEVARSWAASDGSSREGRVPGGGVSLPRGKRLGGWPYGADRAARTGRGCTGGAAGGGVWPWRPTPFMAVPASL